jgi:hypothetical protein
LPGLQEVPILADPYDEQLSFIRRHGYVFRVAHWQHLAVGKVYLKGAERSSVPHLSDIIEFHRFASEKSKPQAAKFKTHFATIRGDLRRAFWNHSRHTIASASQTILRVILDVP